MKTYIVSDSTDINEQKTIIISETKTESVTTSTEEKVTIASLLEKFAAEVAKIEQTKISANAIIDKLEEIEKNTDLVVENRPNRIT